jgi:hypothetical protein
VSEIRTRASGGALTPDEALDELLGDKRTEDHVADLVNAAKALRHWQSIYPQAAAAVVSALLYHMPYREIEAKTGLARSTMHGWLRKQLEGSAEEGGAVSDRPQEL